MARARGTTRGSAREGLAEDHDEDSPGRARAHIDVDAVALPAFALADEHSPGEGGWHAHRMHQLLYAASGMMRLEVEEAQWLLPPQRAAWIAADVRHKVHVVSPVALRTVYLAPSLVPEREGREGAGSLEGCRVFAATPLAREMILYAMRWGPDYRARGERGERGERGAHDDLAARFFAALAAMAAEWAEEALPLRLPTAKTPELARAMRYAINELGGAPTIEEAAKMAALSTRTLARRFESEAQTTWRQFLHQARMMRALELLAQPNARVTDVALEVGFESPGAFTKAFEETTGERPKDYRKRVLGGASSREDPVPDAS